MSQRSHIASSGSTAICACSVACSAPSSDLERQRRRARRRRARTRAPACENSVRGRSSALRSSTSWSGELLALVGEHLLADGDRRRSSASRRSVSRRSSRRSMLGVGLALGLRVPVAGERLDERAPQLEVELAHLVGAAQVQVDGAVVDRRAGARELDGAEQLALRDVDDLDGVRRGRAQRDACGREVLRGAQRERAAALDEQCPARPAPRSARARAGRASRRRRPGRSVPRARRTAGAARWIGSFS